MRLRTEAKGAKALNARVSRGPTFIARALLASAIMLLAGPLASAAEGQSPRARIDAVDDSDVIVVFPVREGMSVCSGPRGSLRVERREGPRAIAGPGSSCRSDSVAVLIERGSGAATRVDLDTRARAAERLDARRVDATGPEAADFLLSLVESAEVRRDRDDAIAAATMARGATVWPRLLELARDPTRSERLRASALLHAGQIAAAESLVPLIEIATDADENDGVRSAAVFALSELPDRRGVAALMEVAESPTTAAVRRSAFFWLAESDDPRVPAFFERVLTAGR